MAIPKLLIAGYCTSTSVKVMAVFDQDTSCTDVAHIRYQAKSLENTTSVPLVNCPPYSIAHFTLQDLPASENGTWLEYSIATEKEETHTYSARLKLLPDGRPLKIALVSCNGIFKILAESRRFALWDSLADQVAAGDVDLIIHAGDQIYADSIYMRHLINYKDVEAITSEYRQVYVETWTASASIQSVLASCPNLMMWDDHDIFDGYGSHGDDSSARPQAIFQAARQAFSEFQAALNPPILASHSFANVARIGDGAVLMLDGRSNRMWKENRVLGQEQLRDVQDWIAAACGWDLDFLLIVTAVPFLHVPVMSYLKFLDLTDWNFELREDLRDSWTASNNGTEAQALLNLFFDFSVRSQKTRVFLLSGDVHVGTVGTIESASHPTQTSRAAITQIVSSGIGSPPPYGIVRMLLRWAAPSSVSLLNGEFTGSLRRLSSPDQDFLLAKRNFAVLHLNETVSVEFFADYKNKVIRFTEPL